MKHIFHELMLRTYEHAVDHAAKTDATVEAKKPDLMKQASAQIEAMLRPVFT